jgi:uncharacterized protein with PIN domain
MIIDTSALVTILDQEPEAERIVRAMATASDRRLSAANLVEAGIVMQARRGDEACTSSRSQSAAGTRANKFAVGTLIAERPPHRSVRAGFPHTAPTSGV